MAAAANQDIFDVRRVRRLVELMKEHDLNEIDIRQDDARIQLRRGMGGVPSVVTTAAPVPAAAVPAPATPAAEVAAAEVAPVDDAKLIISPIVGTFYSSPDPEASPYTKVGDHVGPETIVCIIEAMKVFNEIPAEVSGEVIAVLVQNGDPVEFGQPLFKVK